MRSILRLPADRGAILIGLVASIAAPILWFSSPSGATPAAPAPTPAVSNTPSVGNVIELRPNRIDLRVDGFVENSIGYSGPALTIEALTDLVARPSWLDRSGDTVVLRAGLFQAPNTSLMFAAPTVRLVQLIGDMSGVGGTIRGTSAKVSFHGVSVTGWDPGTSQPAKESPERPYVYFMHGSTVQVASTVFDHLGRATKNARGVTLGSQTTGSVSNATFSNSDTGLSLVGTGAVTITGCAVTRSSSDGVVVKAAGPISMQNVTSVHNARYGMSIDHGEAARLIDVTTSANSGGGIRLIGTAHAAMQAVTAASNSGYGIVVDHADASRLIGITTADNADGGIRLTGASAVRLSGLSSTHEPLGLLVDDGSTAITATTLKAIGDETGVVTTTGASRVSLARLTLQSSSKSGLALAGTDVAVSEAHITGAPTGVSLARASTDVRVSHSVITDVGMGVEVRLAAHRVQLSTLTISHVIGDGVLAGSSGIALRELRITSAGSGVRIYGSVAGATLSGSTISRSAVGVSASHTVTGLSVSGVAISDTSTGISSSAANLQASGGSITKTAIAMRVSGDATIAGTQISAVDGLRIGANGHVTISNVRLAATDVGLVVAAGGHLRVDHSAIDAPTLSIGHVSFGPHNSLPQAKLPWYGLAAIAAAVSACLLELVRRLREKAEDQTWLLPASVWNTR